ncbi:DUF4912 domain-containing protein [Leptolyngbya ohadii]|uniref:DUF4912 domain-containing protein n=1 Tax=Leptolyngbya ohadii TaxID=1962290 RepID=UPI000B59F6E5|nr:DUF4912 domain-containing protein [Leptolyngbya ohadii]
MSKNKNRSPGLTRSLASIAAAPLLLLPMGVQARELLIAQAPNSAPAFQLPSSLPNGTSVKVDGSSSMIVSNEGLKQRYEAQFPGTQVNLATGGTDAALNALSEGTIDIAAIGRLLTDAEKAQGLQQVPLSREKIAIIVGSDNPFQASLTAEQFARIFRGEITNWSEVGGPNAPIRFVDRPESSDTRQALSRYPVFQNAPFQTGATATQAADDTAAIIEELGTDGISYAPVSQVPDQPGVRILPMHDTLPTDPRYPYSQPRNYVYKGNATPAVLAFLGFVTSAPGQEAIAAAPPAAPAPSPEAAAAPAAVPAPDTPTATTAPAPDPTAAATAPIAETTPANLSRLWWLLLPLLGLPLLLWFLKGKGAAVPPVAAAAAERKGRIILTPRDCRNAYAYWEVPDGEFAEARRQGGRDLKVRVYDVTDIPNMDRQRPHSMKEFDCAANARDLHVPIALDNRDYLAELGYTTADNEWIPIARSSHVRVPACVPSGNGKGLGTAAVVGGTAAAAVAGVSAAKAIAPTQRVLQPSRMILVPRTPEKGYAYWEVPEARKAELKQEGGEKLMLRLHDVTDKSTDAHTVRYFECDETASDLHLPLTPDRDYVAELGYMTKDNRWLSLAKADAVHAPADIQGTFKPVKRFSPEEEAAKITALKAPEPEVGMMGRLGELAGGTTNRVTDLAGDARKGTANLLEKVTNTTTNLAGNTTAAMGAAIAGGTAAVAGAASGAKSLLNRQTSEAGSSEAVKKFEQPQDCRIILVPRNSKDAYAYWEVSESYKKVLREQGGTRLMLRVHDATNIDIDDQPPHSTQTYPCKETDQDKHVAIPVSDRDYIAEIGYFTEDDRWLRLIRSFHVHVPAGN